MLHWYDGDGENDDVAAMLRNAIADLQIDRAEVVEIGSVKRELSAVQSDVSSEAGPHGFRLAEYECARLFLDDLGIPTEEDDKVFSLVGRIKAAIAKEHSSGE